MANKKGNRMSILAGYLIDLVLGESDRLKCEELVEVWLEGFKQEVLKRNV